MRPWLGVFTDRSDKAQDRCARSPIAQDMCLGDSNVFKTAGETPEELTAVVLACDGVDRAVGTFQQVEEGTQPAPVEEPAAEPALVGQAGSI